MPFPCACVARHRLAAAPWPHAPGHLLPQSPRICIYNATCVALQKKQIVPYALVVSPAARAIASSVPGAASAHPAATAAPCLVCCCDGVPPCSNPDVVHIAARSRLRRLPHIIVKVSSRPPLLPRHRHVPASPSSRARITVAQRSSSSRAPHLTARPLTSTSPHPRSRH